MHQHRGAGHVTLTDVAREAGVSRALASIVLREAPGASEQSRARVLAVVERLGYRPDLRARSLASLQAHVVGVLFGRAGRFHLDLIDGPYAAVEAQGWDLVLSALTASRNEEQALGSLHDLRFDALVMLGPEVARPLLAGDVPLVTMGWQVDHPQVDSVRTDDDHGMQLAVGHLTGLGHRRIAHLQGGSGLIAIARRDAYLRAMRSAGLQRRTRVVACDGEDQIDGQRAARALVQARGLPSALIAFNDDIAAAAMSVLAQEGVGVPERVSVIGVDDSELARTPGIDLTSIQQRPREMARLAVERAIARSATPDLPAADLVLRPELVIRSTTGPVTAP